LPQNALNHLQLYPQTYAPGGIVGRGSACLYNILFTRAVRESLWKEGRNGKCEEGAGEKNSICVTGMS